ncbi:unnamed protein product [Lactuca saligna]|uniref:Reverse transcriptase zinc-binding domain-containing protein n=1 Tax=Lactuca saligna TaxID=75948 RepID=A0AA36DZR2_LACSI|nr:unnamed protein product [Lactuca saligna]
MAFNFPHLLKLDKRKSCFVAERIGSHRLKWDWKRKPNTVIEREELDLLVRLVERVQFSSKPDKWKSRFSGDGGFYVHDLRSVIEDLNAPVVYNPTVWPKIVPLKVSIFVWRACMDRIPTAMALARRGVNGMSTSCLLCNVGSDETNHILLHCPVARDALMWLLNWCNNQPPAFNGVGELVKFVGCWGSCPKRRKILIALCYGFLWCAWKIRNERRFNDTCSSQSKLADNVVSLVFGWVKYRGNFDSCKWEDRCISPFNVL